MSTESGVVSQERSRIVTNASIAESGLGTNSECESRYSFATVLAGAIVGCRGESRSTFRFIADCSVFLFVSGGCTGYFEVFSKRPFCSIAFGTGTT